MSTWNAFINQFPPDEREAAQALVTILRTTLNIQSLEAIAELQPHELANVLAMAMPDNPFIQQDDEERLALARRMIKAARQALASATTPQPETPASGSTTPAQPSAPPTSRVVYGRVLSEELKPLPQVIVRVFDKDLRHEEPLGDSTTDAEGKYRIEYEPIPPRAEGIPTADVIVRAYQRTAKGEVALATSRVRFQASANEQVDVIVGEQQWSEFERLVRLLTPVLDGASIADLLQADVEFLARDTGFDPVRIGFLAIAYRMAAHTKLPAEAFYNYLTASRMGSGGTLERFWRTLVSEFGLDTKQADTFRFASLAGDVVRFDVRLVDALLARWSNGDIFSAIDVAVWTSDDWLELLDATWDGAAAQIPAWADGEDRAARLAYAAAWTSGRAEQVFPRPFVGRRLITGQIVTPNDRPAAGVKVQAFHCAFKNAVPISAAVRSADDGTYRIVLDPHLLRRILTANGKLPLQLQVRVRTEDGQPAGQSDIHADVRLPATIHIRIARDAGPREFEVVGRRIGFAIADASPASIPADRLKWLAGAARVDLDTTGRFIAAHQSAAANPGLPAAVFYALSHHAVKAAAGAGAVSAEEKLQVAVDAGIVSQDVLDHAAAAAAWMTRVATDARTAELMTRAPAGARARPADILHAIGVPDNAVKAYARILAEDPRAKPATIGGRLNEARVPADVQATIRRGFRLAEMVGFDAPLIGALISELEPPRSRGKTISADDEEDNAIAALARLSADEWEGRLKRVAEGADPRQMRTHARAIEATFERAYPRDALLASLSAVKAGENGPDVAALRTFLEKNKKIDIRGKALKFQALDGADGDVKRDLGKLQRLSRVASFGDAALLLTQGYSSARGIASTSRSSFVRKYVEARKPRDLSPEESAKPEAILKEHAEAIHRRATRQAAAAMAVTTALSPNYHVAAPAAARSVWRGGSHVPEDVKADLEGLFGAQDACSVTPCQSVLGIPAYLVDLLELVDDGELTPNPIDVLRARRPDLLEIQLSCANAETLLPYIDLVIELLERTVAKAAGAAYPQTTWPAEDLAAFPEHLNAEVYTRLASEVFPWDLPFSLAHVEADTYLADLGMSRDELMRTLKPRGPGGWAPTEALEIASAFLKINPKARDVITGAAHVNAPWKCWGYADRPERWPSRIGENVSAFLTRTRLEFADLQELLESDYINPVDGTERRVAAVAGADACDLTQMTLRSVDATFLDRFHRVVRLWRALGWTIREVDRAIAVFRAADITGALLVQIADAARLSARLKLPIATVLTFWGNLDTSTSLDRSSTPPKRQPSQYDRLFQDRSRLSAEQRATLAFPFAATASAEQTRAGAAAVLGLTAADEALLTARDESLLTGPPSVPGPPGLLSTVSHLHRWHTLSRAVDLPIRDLLRVQAMTGIDPFASTAATTRFVDVIDVIRRRGFSVDDVDFLLRHVTSAERQRRFADDAAKLMLRVKNAVYRPGLARTREEICRVFEELLGAAAGGGDAAARIVDLLEGTGICSKPLNDPEIAEADGIRLATGDVLTVTDVRDRLQPLATAVGGDVDDCAGPLVKKGTPGQTSSPSYPGVARDNVLLDNDRVAAIMIAPVLGAEIARAYRISEGAAQVLLARVMNGGAPAIRLVARAVRTGAVLADTTWAACVSLAKGAWLAGRLDFSSDDLSMASDVPQAPLTVLPPDLLPATSVATPPAVAPGTLFDRWLALGDLGDLRRRIAATGSSLWTVHAAAEGGAVESWTTVLQQTGRATPDVATLLGASLLGINEPAKAASPSTWLRVLDAADCAARPGVAPVSLKAWASDTLADPPDAPPLPTSAAIRNTAAAKRGTGEWRKVAPALRNGIRVKQRDALVSCAIVDCKVEDADALQGQYLVDVEIGPDQFTTRLGLATAAVQRFVQRAMLGSEKHNGRTIALSEEFEDTWAWMKSYRTWRECRKVFLYPENFILPEARDDKSPFFLELEQMLSQRDLTDQTIDEAIGGYLQKLDEVARIEITGTCLEKAGDDELLHIVARTRGVPQHYYHRIWNVSTQCFSAWTRLDLDIEGDWVVPAVLDGRLHLYWIKHTKQLEGIKDALGHVASRPFPLSAHYPMYQDQYSLSWSTRHRKGWSPKKTADHHIARPFFPIAPANFAVRLDRDRLRIGGVTLLPQPPPTVGGLRTGGHTAHALTFGGGGSSVSIGPSGVSVQTDYGSASAGTSGVHVETGAGSAGVDAQGNPYVNPNPPPEFGVPFQGENTPQFPSLDFQPVIDELVRIKRTVEGLSTAIGNLGASLPGEIWNRLPDDLREAIAYLSQQAGTFRQTIDALWGIVNPPDTLPDRIAASIVKMGAEFVVVLGRALDEVWKAVQNGAASAGQIISGAFGDQMQRLISDVLQFRPGWSGPVPGFEFGFFDISESGAKALRLAPPPYFAPPLGLEAAGAAAVSMALSNLLAGLAALNEAGRLMYSLFPGYPGLYDVPVLTGVLSTDLPLMQGAADEDAMVKAWPGSGYFLVLNESLIEIPSYCSVMINMAEIAKEETVGLAEAAGVLSGGPTGPSGAIQKVLSGVTGTATFLSEKVENVASLLNVGMRVVRPVPFGPFPGRLRHPPPTIVSEDRHGRVFLMARALDFKTRRPVWNVISLYHPLATTLSRAYDREGAAAVYRSGARPGGEAWRRGDNTSEQNDAREAFYKAFAVLDPLLQPDQSGVNLTGLSFERLELSPRGAYSLYNWELFFHIPMLFAARHAAQQGFDRAIAWYRNVFDPTVSSGPAPQRYWRFKQFHDEFDQVNSITRWLTSLADGTNDDNQASVVAEWRRDPFNPHRVARLRAGAYERAVVMRTVETLVNWGDARFREATWETINEASQLYLMAREVLGERPKLVPARPAGALTYNELQRTVREQGHEIDAFGNALLTIESALPAEVDEADADPSGSLVVLSGVSMMYFGIPVNERLLEFWDIVEDRLFKIRHSLDIRGKARSRYPDGIGLEASSALAAAGTIADTAAGALATVPLPAYRFQVMVQKANEFAGDVRALGAAVLSAMEKRDGEALARLRASHEIALLQAALRVRGLQIEEAQHALEAAMRGREGAENRHRYYTSREFISATEAVKEALFIVASGLQVASGGLELTAAVMHALPDVTVGAGGHGNSPHGSVSYGASQLGNAVSATARALSLMSSVAQIGSTMAGTLATYERRKEEWDHQAKLAENDMEQFDHQVAGARARLQIAVRELENQRKQIAHSQEVAAFMQQKFTNQELYEWMLGQISAVHFQGYLLAVDMARRAEACYRFERAPEEPAFIRMEPWNSLATGLFAGERLQQDLRRMEAAYMERNTRECELTKQVSFALVDPVALLMLQQKGECYVDLPERVFDADHPGHYLRRLKTVSLSIPCVAGPYTSVNCRLTLVNSRIRIKPDVPSDYSDRAAFRTYPTCISAIATSGGQSDSGMFELNLKDERYLPFEGAGAISTWRIELPHATNRFDFSTISDVILHLRYTARDGGPQLREAAWNATFDQQTTRFPEALPKPPDPQAAPAPRAASRMFSARRDFADAWYRFLNPRDNQPDLLLDFDLSPARFPYPVAGAATMLKTLKVVLLTESAAGANLKARLAWVGVDGNATPIPGHPVPEPPAGTPPAPVRFSGDAALAGLRSATFGVPSAANTGIWRLQISRSDNAGSAGGLLQPGATPDVIRIDRAQIHDIVVICSYDPA